MNPYTIDVRFDFEFDDDEIQTLLDQALLDHLHRAAVLTLQQQQIEGPAALTVLLTSDEALQAMNKEFRGYDQPTDVLSFESDLDLPEIGRYLGDIAISIPTAIKQAAEQNHRPWAEFELLTVHGVLHLLGHDHGDEEEKAVMWGAQDEVISQLRNNQ